jgi:hypothetical protein
LAPLFGRRQPGADAVLGVQGDMVFEFGSKIFFRLPRA